ncbi:hypothetical protein [Spirulina sp. 06S082]|uniref:hypothetical protein n=1 Tax=Spirulina sp. 06S082 TaxID=3110248 RepID=UPI002B2041B3|nr:hypothetical protein [Spirulina sp. 06S082]MEA5469695.1 hypothetical protein [Spirulina sp. 06S082]
MDRKPQQYLRLRPRSESALGQILAYLETHPGDRQELASQTLQARFLPFVLDKTDPHSRGIARQCLEECLAYARAIASEWELEISDMSTMRSPQPSPNSPTDNEENSEDEEAAKEFSKTKDLLGL